MTKNLIHVEIRGKGAPLCLGCRWWKWNGLGMDMHCLCPSAPWYSFERRSGCRFRDPDESFDPNVLLREIAALEAARHHKGGSI